MRTQHWMVIGLSSLATAYGGSAAAQPLSSYNLSSFDPNPAQPSYSAPAQPGPSPTTVYHDVPARMPTPARTYAANSPPGPVKWEHPPADVVHFLENPSTFADCRLNTVVFCSVKFLVDGRPRQFNPTIRCYTDFSLAQPISCPNACPRRNPGSRASF